ncbi:MAG: outer membrane protein assembly factor BamD [Bacteroidota bacterium]|nr:outer membrane protein assembly factor BamD [Bacteroidota bacterium]
MRNIKVLFYPLIFIALSCGGEEKTPHEKSIDEIKAWQIKADSSIQKNENVSGICDSLITHYEHFVNAYPQDTFVPECLERIASLNQRLKQFEKAEIAMEKFQKMFPKHKKIPFILFQEAIMFQTDMHQLGKAKDKFNELILKYPNTKWASDAKIIMESNASSDIELFNSIMKNAEDKKITKK